MPQCLEAAASRLVDGSVALAEQTLAFLGEVSGVSGLIRAVRGTDENGAPLGVGQRLAEGALATVGLVPIPGGGGAVQGTKAAVRGGLTSLGLADDVAKGVRGVLSSGRGEQWGVEATKEGGAIVHRFVKGGDGKSSAIYTYIVDKAGRVAGTVQRGFDEAGNLIHFDPK